VVDFFKRLERALVGFFPDKAVLGHSALSSWVPPGDIPVSR
jgi:hypothetical protein